MILWQAGREGEERLMSELGNVTQRPEDGHLTLEVKAANEMTCDSVWEKLYLLPPFCNLH
jgi:hypothetical protein